MNYNTAYDWSPIETSEEERIGMLMTAADAGASAVDIQGYTYHLPSKSNYLGKSNFSFTRGNPKEIVTDELIIEKQIELIETFHQKGTEVLLSTHPSIPMKCMQVIELARFLEKRNPDIIKIITPCENDEQLLEAFKTMLELKKAIPDRKVVFLCGGKAGRLTRLINPIFGSYMTFCIDGFSESSNPEQIHLKTAADVISGIKKIL